MFEFRKYHGLGNDFIVAEGGASRLRKDQVIALCRRHHGVGADGVLLVQPVDGGSVPTFEMIIFNRDGSRPGMCGNGVRCVAAFARDRWGAGDDMIIDSDAGPRRCTIRKQVDEGHWHIAVDMGETKIGAETKPLVVGNHRFEYVPVDVGNPHAVVFDLPGRQVVEEVGRFANDDHQAFSGGVNVEFAARRDDGAGYAVMVYEKGVGMTNACGTGACAVAAAAWHTGRSPVDREVTIEFPGGALTIERGDGGVWMTGSAEEVFRGQTELG